MKNNGRLTLNLKMVGAWLADGRESMRLTYRQLADKTGISPSQLLRMEEGKVECSVINLVRVCAALGLPVSSILDEALMHNFYLYPGAHYTRDFKADWAALPDNGKAVVGPIDAKSFQFRMLVYSQMINNSTIAVSRLLHSAFPSALVSQFEFGRGVFSGRFLRFADFVAGSSNVEKVAIAERLADNPHAMLVRYDLYTEDEIQRGVEQGLAYIGLPMSPYALQIASALAGSSRSKKVRDERAKN